MLKREGAVFLGRALVLLLIGFAFYARSIDNFWIKDDLALGNLMAGEALSFSAWLKELLPVGMSGEHYWRPIPLLPGFVEHALWGLDVRGYHVTNILLQVLCGVGVMRLVDRLGRGRDGGAGLGAGLLVVLAPTGAESVVWIMQRMVLMTGLFSLLGLLARLRGVEEDRRGQRVLALVFFALALLSKETALGLPGLFFLIDLVRAPAGLSFATRLGRALRGAIAPAILIALYFLARYLFWGRLVNSYAGMEVLDYARHNRVFERLGATLLNALLPANPDLLGRLPASLLRFAMATAYLIAIPRLVLLLVRSERHRAGVACGLSFALLAVLPILPIVWIDERLFNARFCHGPMLGLALVLGPAFFAAMPGRGARLLDAAGRLAGALALVAYAIALAAQLVAFDRGSEQIVAIRAGLVAAAEERRALGAIDPVFVVLDTPDQYLGVPTLEYSLVQAMKPPFTSPAVRVLPLLARDAPTRGLWLADLERQLATLEIAPEGLVFVACTSRPVGVRPVFGPRGAARGEAPARPIAPPDLSFLSNRGEEPDFVFESSDPGARSFRLVFVTPDVAFEFGPILVPGTNCIEERPGRFRFRPSFRDPTQPELPDLWAKVVRRELPRPLEIVWRVESLDAEGATIAVSLDQRLLVFDAAP